MSTGRIEKEQLHEFVLMLEDARDFVVNLTSIFTDEQLIAKRQEMIDEVCSRVKPVLGEIYIEKLINLFGNLAKEYLKDKTLLKHRAEHGGIDIF